MNEKPRSRPVVELAFLLVPLLAGILFSLAGKEVRSGAFLIGDCPYYASTAMSLWRDGDVDLANQLRGGLPVHHRQVALSHDGRVMPKHPVLMPVLSLPFYVLFGVSGFLIFNVVVLVLLAVVAWAMARIYVGPVAAVLATLTIFAATFLRTYAYNYSPDLLSTLLVLAGILLILKHRPAAGGLFLGLSVLAKVTNVFVAATAGLLLLFRQPRMNAIRAGLGMLPGVAAWMLINLLMFGGPTVTGYDRTIVLEKGVVHIVSHKGFFDLPILEGMRGQLLHPRQGLLTTSPVLLLAIPGYMLFLRKRPWDGALFLAVSEMLFVLFSVYRWWATSHYGNRFLMVLVVLAAVPIAFVYQAIVTRVRPASRSLIE